MEKQKARVTLRLPREQRQKINKLVEAGKYRNISQVIRVALSKFLEKS